MTAVLAAAARAVLGTVLVLLALASMLWAAYGPQGPWVLAWLVLACAVVTAAVLAWHALPPRREEGSDG